MLEQINHAGSFTLPSSEMTLNRLGYGAMQVAGRDGNKLVWGPPRDIDAAIAVLREAVASGVNHIDTADFYGPHVTNQIIRRALSPYPEDLVIVTKVSAQLADVCFRCLPSKDTPDPRVRPGQPAKLKRRGKHPIPDRRELGCLLPRLEHLQHVAANYGSLNAEPAVKPVNVCPAPPRRAPRRRPPLLISSWSMDIWTGV